jgi:hypothetical protein
MPVVPTAANPRQGLAALIFAASQGCDKGGLKEGGVMGDPTKVPDPKEEPKKPEDEDEEEEENGEKASA